MFIIRVIWFFWYSEITSLSYDGSLLIFKKDSSVFNQYKLNLIRNSNYLVIKGIFKKADNVQIILDNVLSKKTYDVDVLSGNETVSGKMNTATYISQEGVYGKYYIYLKINGTTYKLSKYVMMS